ncbi:MAG: NYN domain-containing protein [Nanoarchaeota archaeon]
MKKERVSIFIDGSNFYYSTSKKGNKIKFEKLINELVRDRELIRVYYYVAPLDIKKDESKYWKHQRFLEMLNDIPKFNVVLCTLKKIKVKNEEPIYLVKGDDVRLSNNLLMDAVDDLYDTAIVVSGDEDFADSIKIVKNRYGKKVGNAYFIKTSSYNLRRACDFTVKLDNILDKITDKKESSALSEDHTEH